MTTDLSGIWLEVANVRLDTKNGSPHSVSVQVHGDKEGPPKTWWPMHLAAEEAGDTYRRIANALDRKQSVLIRLRPLHAQDSEPSLQALEYRIQRTS